MHGERRAAVAHLRAAQAWARENGPSGLQAKQVEGELFSLFFLLSFLYLFIFQNLFSNRIF
jgi:hypothetical protein